MALVPSRRNRRNQRGALLIEAIFAALVIAGFLTTYFALNWESSQDRRDLQTAEQTRLVVQATRDYIAAHHAAVAANAQADPSNIIEIPVSVLQGANSLPATFHNSNAYGQTYTVHVRWLGANRLEVIVPTTGGTAIPPTRIGRVASMVGASGGFVETPTTARGAQGGWEMDISPYQAAGAGLEDGRLLTTLYYADGALLADFLYRNPVPGWPEANTMNTDINMGGNDILNAANLRATAEVSGNIVLASTHVQIGDQTIAQPQAQMINDLFGLTCGANEAVRLVGGAPTCVSAVPAGTIAAFNAAACPAGWTEVTAAAGRTLVGAGAYSQTYTPGDRPAWSFSQIYGVGQTGGHATWQQSEPEIARHRHRVGVLDSAWGNRGAGGANSLANVANNGGGVVSSLGRIENPDTWGPLTTEAGNDAPMENRMPYLVVRWCVKS